MADPTCEHREYTAEDAQRDLGIATGAVCGNPARWANCDPIGMPACDEHVCRCRIPLGEYDHRPLQYGEDRRQRGTPTSMADGFLIWWTTQADCEAIGGAEALGKTPALPEYLILELRSRIGRNGRGRLWVSGLLNGAPAGTTTWPTTALAYVLEGQYGGIVIRAEDRFALADMPGVITDFNVRRV